MKTLRFEGSDLGTRDVKIEAGRYTVSSPKDRQTHFDARDDRGLELLEKRLWIPINESALRLSSAMNTTIGPRPWTVFRISTG
jgi:hypothetical protein